MRAGLVALGIILAVLGATLLFVPILPQSHETINSAETTPYYAGSVSGFSLSGSIPIAVSWTVNGTDPVEVVAAACSGACTNVSEISSEAYENGTAGSFTLAQPNGGTVVLGVLYDGTPGEIVTFQITIGAATVATVLVAVGLLVLIVGVVARRPTPPAPEVPPTAPPPPPTG